MDTQASNAKIIPGGTEDWNILGCGWIKKPNECDGGQAVYKMSSQGGEKLLR
jgi:hypothetical protein